MPISASFSLASSRRFATWTSSAILVPFGAHRTTFYECGGRLGEKDDCFVAVPGAAN
jgi:hypothetical protein